MFFCCCFSFAARVLCFRCSTSSPRHVSILFTTTLFMLDARVVSFGLCLHQRMIHRSMNILYLCHRAETATMISCCDDATLMSCWSYALVHLPSGRSQRSITTGYPFAIWKFYCIYIIYVLCVCVVVINTNYEWFIRQPGSNALPVCLMVYLLWACCT